jgi:hypothetical protein
MLVSCTPRWIINECMKLTRTVALQAKALAKNLDLVVRGQQPVVYSTDTPPVIAVTLGRSKGTGRRGNMKFPSIIVCKYPFQVSYDGVVLC